MQATFNSRPNFLCGTSLLSGTVIKHPIFNRDHVLPGKGNFLSASGPFSIIWGRREFSQVTDYGTLIRKHIHSLFRTFSSKSTDRNLKYCRKRPFLVHFGAFWAIFCPKLFAPPPPVYPLIKSSQFIQLGMYLTTYTTTAQLLSVSIVSTTPPPPPPPHPRAHMTGINVFTHLVIQSG